MGALHRASIRAWTAFGRARRKIVRFVANIDPFGLDGATIPRIPDEVFGNVSECSMHLRPSFLISLAALSLSCASTALAGGVRITAAEFRDDIAFVRDAVL